MPKSLNLLFLLSLLPLYITAQTIKPEEGRALNYRIIGFTFPGQEHAVNYKVEIASGNYIEENAFQKNIIVTATAKKNKIIAEVPAFGQQYTWRTVSIDNRSKSTKSKLHHFSTLTSPDVNPDSTRMRIINSAVKYKDDYVFVDGNKVLYDMNGNPVWFFPQIDNITPDDLHIRDLKLTPFGTLTVIIGEKIYEINYNGDILWKDPGNGVKIKDSTSMSSVHHHEFTRLANGHYMALAFEQKLWQLPTALDSLAYTFLHGRIKLDSSTNTFYQKIIFGTLVEYDEQGHIVWTWSSSDYFKGSDLSKRMISDKIFNLDNTHENAFYFDEKAQNIYVSFREINRIVKIHYPDKKVLDFYGKTYVPGERNMNNGMFCGQHGCRLSAEGYLYMYNNNTCNRRARPTIVMFKEPRSEKDSLTKVWEFECPMDELSIQDQRALTFTFGGNVLELPDTSLFVCTGGTYGKLFIVNRDKNILWCAQPEKWDKAANGWTKQGVFLENQMREGSYRASIITPGELENLIWNEPLKK